MNWIRNKYEIYSEILKGRSHMGELNLYWRITLRQIFNEFGVRGCMGFK
jgi:hypothetical protein